MSTTALIPAIAVYITDLEASLVPNHNYLLTFDLPAGIPIDILRKIADSAQMADAFLGHVEKNSHIDLLGTTVADRGPGKNPQLLALVRCIGTPLLAAVAPIVAITLIVATVYLVMQFKHAVDVTVVAAGKTISDVGDAVKVLAEDAGNTLQKAGTGLEYALPILAVALAAVGAVWFVGFRKAVA